ncbi:uncharacterized protein LOC114855896 [Betta splendens]|uniref:Uncharacterized protein LOC114855896 n=1 Tax=Betta splendens TaxID=158456 RepID=A0A6P7MKF2_BETSP|nr:uncharacterized protein LOC114855896 [Betta splendens]
MGCWLSGPWMGDQMVNGRSLAHLSQRDALQILAANQRPITMQIKGRRGRSNEAERGNWEPLPLNLQHLNLPLPMMGAGLNASSPVYQDRHYYGHLSLPQDHCDGGRYSYLSSSPRDTVDISLQDPELTSRRPKGQNCLMGCCKSSLEEPSGCHSQTDDEDFMLEKPLGFLPLHHELDSGLGWTDGSLHQGDLSGLETEEGGLEDCHSHGALAPGGCGGFGGGSPSSESFISSELSDSGFYSVSTGEFRHFQRLLEKRMRLYNARLQHQGEPCERRERRDSCPKSHRELLEAIPEALTVQQQCQGLGALEMEEESGSVMDLPPRGLFRVSSVQFHKADRPCLNRHSSSSGALFNPSHAHAAVSRLTAPVLSTCSTPSSHRRPLVPMQQHHQGSSSVGMLRRSRTLHHRPHPQEYRRRASHPASPSYCAATLHHCGGAIPRNVLPPRLPEEGELEAGLALASQQQPSAAGHLRNTNMHERCYDSSSNSQVAHHDWWHSQERTLMPEKMMSDREREIEAELEQKQQMQKEKELEREREREAQIQEEVERERQQEMKRSRFREQHSLNHSLQAGDVNDTWPKPASRQLQGGGGGRGLYSTLEGHTGTGVAAGCEAPIGYMSQRLSPSASSALQPKTNPSSKVNATTRVSRNQLLRDRASQLADERSGMSTDDETNTDILMGRYWSRTERKEHFLLAREQKQQQQLQARGGNLRDGSALDNRGVGPFAEARYNTVLELSQRKLNRLRNRKLLDDWTTVEELLTHGTRLDNQEDMLCPSSLLTVTTV